MKKIHQKIRLKDPSGFLVLHLLLFRQERLPRTFNFLLFT